MKPSWIIWTAVFSFMCGWPTGGGATPIAYTFALIADSNEPVGSFNSNIFPAINSRGAVAFEGFTQTGVEGIFVGSGGALTTVATNGPGSPFAFFGPGGQAGPVINADGTVAFIGWLKAGGQGIFVGSGGPVTTVAETVLLSESFQGVDINDAGIVAFGRQSPGGAAILTSSNGMFTKIADTAFIFGGVSISNPGVVAFVSPLPTTDAILFTGSGGGLTPIVSTGVAGPFFQLGSFSINTGGAVAFQAFLARTNLVEGNGIFVGSGGPIMTIADDSGPYFLFDGPAINADGVVAFRAILDSGGVGIFTGADPALDRVIVTGEPLFGSIVRTLVFGGGNALNDAGQLTFFAGLEDGRTVLVRADPAAVPEPSTVLCLACALVGLLGYRSLGGKNQSLLLRSMSAIPSMRKVSRRRLNG
jgi:hypothetical protein